MPPDNLRPQTGDWFLFTGVDHIIDYLVTNFWNQAEQPNEWKVARLSPAVFVFRERLTGFSIVAKYYSKKSRSDADRHADREYQYTLRAWETKTSDNGMRPVRPLGLWRSTIFLEYVDGLTLGDIIAVRRSQPGELLRVLEKMGKFLAGLHLRNIRPCTKQDFGQAADYTYKLVDNLVQHGVLQNNPTVEDGLGRLIEKWTSDPLMWEFEATLNHGDATTSNFIFSQNGDGVAVDWERSNYADPAADLGRLVAEVTHAIDKHGGNITEARDLTQKLVDAYCKSLPSSWHINVLLHRVRFYQASSSLRIARNGWLSRKERLALVTQALAILS